MYWSLGILRFKQSDLAIVNGNSSERRKMGKLHGVSPFLLSSLIFIMLLTLVSPPSTIQSKITLTNFSTTMFWSSKIYYKYNFMVNVSLSILCDYLSCTLIALLIAWKLTVIIRRELLLSDSWCSLSLYLYLIDWRSFTLI